MRIYRGKRKDNGEWLYGDLIQYGISTPAISSKEDYTPYKVDPETVGQQIGKKDNTGTEIYEGDQIEHWYEECFFQGVVRGTVLWSDSDCCYEVQYDSVSMPINILDLDSVDDLKIIGNMYEADERPLKPLPEENK